jgi:beta-phosphoglucomutase-like phosphatase (HAD superfamily)
MLGISRQSVVRKRGDVTSPFYHCPIEAIIFDLDGTLLDSAAQIAAAINVLFRARGLETFDEVEIAQFIGWGSRHLIELAFASRGSILSDKQIAAQEKLYLANYASIAERDIVFFPGAINLIRTMAERELTLGICTNKPERIARAILQKAELLPMFDAIIGGDSGFGLKPSPALTTRGRSFSLGRQLRPCDRRAFAHQETFRNPCGLHRSGQRDWASRASSRSRCAGGPGLYLW